MAVYTRFGAPVAILEAEQRPRWYVIYTSGVRRIYDAEPTDKQTKNARAVETFDLWWIKIKTIGVYPDGSGAAGIGKPLDWLPENEFTADGGIREIHDECEMKRDDRRLEK